MVRSLITKPFKAFASYSRSSFDELRKVNWPTREQAIQYTTVVVVSVVVITALTATLDYGLSQILTRFLTWSQK